MKVNVNAASINTETNDPPGTEIPINDVSSPSTPASIQTATTEQPIEATKSDDVHADEPEASQKTA